MGTERGGGKGLGRRGGLRHGRAASRPARQRRQRRLQLRHGCWLVSAQSRSFEDHQLSAAATAGSATAAAACVAAGRPAGSRRCCSGGPLLGVAVGLSAAAVRRASAGVAGQRAPQRSFRLVGSPPALSQVPGSRGAAPVRASAAAIIAPMQEGFGPSACWAARQLIGDRTMRRAAAAQAHRLSAALPALALRLQPAARSVEQHNCSPHSHMAGAITIALIAPTHHSRRRRSAANPACRPWPSATPSRPRRAFTAAPSIMAQSAAASTAAALPPKPREVRLRCFLLACNRGMLCEACCDSPTAPDSRAAAKVTSLRPPCLKPSQRSAGA